MQVHTSTLTNSCTTNTSHVQTSNIRASINWQLASALVLKGAGVFSKVRSTGKESQGWQRFNAAKGLHQPLLWSPDEKWALPTCEASLNITARHKERADMKLPLAKTYCSQKNPFHSRTRSQSPAIGQRLLTCREHEPRK